MQKHREVKVSVEFREWSLAIQHSGMLCGKLIEAECSELKVVKSSVECTISWGGPGELHGGGGP